MKTLIAVLLLLCLIEGLNTNYQIGTGIYDITGPIAEVGMMGYAMINQRASGLHYRLRSRAFVIGDGTKMVVYVTTDSCMTFTGVRQKVMERLQATYGDIFTYDNVLISGEHTHSGPAGFSYYLLYDITSYGFYEENHEVIVNGIYKSIVNAYQNFQNDKGSAIFINSGELLDTNINRSPSAYTANPSEERAKYKYDVDKIMTTLRFENAVGNFAALSFFPVHGTSMNNTNTLISGDNKGYASYLFEKLMNGNATAPGQGPFVAAFGQSNEGDVSPNTKGAHCLNGLPCEVAHSTCGGTSEGCIASGPGKDDFESTQIIGTNQFKKAVDLFNSATIQLEGPIDFIHTWVEMDNVTVSPNFTSTGKTGYTCLAALGDSFAGGTTDGPGEFNFVQGTNLSTTNPYWNFIGNLLSEPTDEQIACQYPKPILLNVGGINIPYQWVPEILPLQILRVGQLYLVGVPGEFTTMSGRRLRDTILNVLIDNGASNTSIVVICGLSGAYSHYITTYEEFQYQRYEGASTLYGPHTLAAYQQEYSKLAEALFNQVPYPAGTPPPDLSGNTLSFIPPPAPDFDVGHGYGSIQTPALDSYQIGEQVSVTFYGGNPRNDFRTQDTYLTVQLEVSNGQWQTVLTDSDWDTKFFFESEYLVESLVTITWDIAPGTVPGNYRIQTFGTAKTWDLNLVPYTGVSNVFTVSA
jgi:neutral ceramidase